MASPKAELEKLKAANDALAAELGRALVDLGNARGEAARLKALLAQSTVDADELKHLRLIVYPQGG